MKISKLFFLAGFVTAAFSLGACSSKTTVDVISKQGIIMDGTQVVPAKPGAWNGALDISYNKGTRTLTYKVAWNALSGTPTSIGLYGTAAKGYNILPSATYPTPYTPIQNFTSGFIGTTAGTFSATIFIDGIVLTEPNLYQGEYYVVVKTAASPNGEIRGQVQF